MKKKRIVSRIMHEMSDYRISHFEKYVEIYYNNELVCLITNVKDYIENLSLIKCMFQGGLMYAKISSLELKRMYKDNIKSTFTKKVNEVEEKVVKSVVKVVESTIKKIKKWYKVTNIFDLKSTMKESMGFVTTMSKEPIQCLRFRFEY